MRSAAKIVKHLLEDDSDQYAEKLLAVIHKGPIRAIGGIVYDSDNKALMSTTDLHGAIRNLADRKIIIQRTDAGGSPTWDVVPSTEHMLAMPKPRKPRRRM